MSRPFFALRAIISPHELRIAAKAVENAFKRSSILHEWCSASFYPTVHLKSFLPKYLSAWYGLSRHFCALPTRLTRAKRCSASFYTL